MLFSPFSFCSKYALLNAFFLCGNLRVLFFYFAVAVLFSVRTACATEVCFNTVIFCSVRVTDVCFNTIIFCSVSVIRRAMKALFARQS